MGGGHDARDGAEAVCPAELMVCAGGRVGCSGTGGHGEQCRPAQGMTTGSGDGFQAAFGYVMLVPIALMAQVCEVCRLHGGQQ